MKTQLQEGLRREPPDYEAPTSEEQSSQRLTQCKMGLAWWGAMGRPRLYLVRALVKHLACPGELVGVGCVLHSRGAGGARPASRQVPADRLLGHIVGQAGAAGTAGGRGASVGEEGTPCFTRDPELGNQMVLAAQILLRGLGSSASDALGHLPSRPDPECRLLLS